MKLTWTKEPLSPSLWFAIAILFFLPLHVSAVVLDPWFVLPPKPIGDGPDYEAIGYGLSQGNGWSTSFSDPRWRRVYEQLPVANAPDYGVQLARRGPIVADTNRPPLLPLCIAALYKVVPRGPIAFGAIRIGLACCLSLGCAVAVAWGVSLAMSSTTSHPAFFPVAVGASLIAIVYSERNLRNYTTDFLTEPLALLLTQVFLFVAWYGSRKGGWTWAVLTGVLFAGMYFSRSFFLLWTPFVIVWLWHLVRFTKPIDSVARLTPARWVIVCMIAFGLIASVWWVRNCFVLGSFHPLGTKGSTTLMGGYCDEAFQARGEWQFAPERALRMEIESKLDLDTATASDLRQLELEMGTLANAKVKDWLLQNMSLLPSLIIKRVVTEWNPYVGKALFLKLLALVGAIWLMRTNRAALIWLTGPLLINTVIVAATYSVGGRFLVPTYGSIYVLAAFGFASILAYLGSALSSNSRSSPLRID